MSFQITSVSSGALPTPSLPMPATALPSQASPGGAGPVSRASGLPSAAASATPTRAPLPTPSAIVIPTRTPVDVVIAPVKTVDYSPQILAQQAAMHKALEDLNQQAQQSNMSVGFSLDKASGLQFVQVTNTHSGEMVMQFPSVKLLDIAASIDQLKGLFYNKKT